VGLQEVDAGGATLPDGLHIDKNHIVTHPVLPEAVASTETSMLETVLQYGTARAASLGQFAAGKTGTTTNFGDAWFIGWDSKYTVAVWVGYPNSLVPMTTEFNGKPVMGGTFPALIWHDFMTAAMQVDKVRAEHTGTNQSSAGGQGANGGGGQESTTTGSSTSARPTPAPQGGTTPGKTAAPTPPAKEPGGGSATPAPEHLAAPARPPSRTPSTPPAGSTSEAPSTPSSPSPPSSGGSSPTGGVSPSG
jgi:penicillin-binding protein 1A